MGRLLLAGAALGVALGACGEGPGPPPPAPSAPARAELRVTPRVAAPGGRLRATLIAHGDTRLEGGYEYRLEALRLGRWRWRNRDQAFIQIVAVATPARPFAQRILLPRDLRPGPHRIVKQMRVASTGERVEASARFQVRPG